MKKELLDELKKCTPEELVAFYYEAKTGREDMYNIVPDNAITDAVGALEEILYFLGIEEEE